MTVVEMSIETTPCKGHPIRRLEYKDEVYINVSDLIYMSDVARDRFHIEDNKCAAEAMERLTYVLSMLSLVVQA